MSIAAQEAVRTAELNPIIAQAVEFTEVFKQHIDAPLAIREAMCLKAQYPATVGKIRPGDVLAGRRRLDRLVYVGTMWWAPPPRKVEGKWSPTKQGGYCFDFGLADEMGKTDEEERVLAGLSEFWKEHCTWTKVNATYDDEMNQFARGNGQIGAGANGFCVAVNLDRMMQRGIPGLMADIDAREVKAKKAGEDTSFFEGLRIALQVVIDVAKHYREQALSMAADAVESGEIARLKTMAATLDAILDHAPRNFREAVQLYWLYTTLVSGNHPEAFRIDQALGDFLANDIDSGRMTEEECIQLLVALWKMTSENGADALCRIVIGGMGRRNPVNADRFCMAAMEATRRRRHITPQLTLRFHKEQDPKLLKKAFDCIGEGCCYPMLYNDDVVVPGVMRSMDVPQAAAEHYYPLGCGEFMVGWESPSLLCCGWSIPKSLDAAMRNGTSDGRQIGPKTGETASLDTFEKLYESFLWQVRFSAGISAKAYRKVCECVPKECPFLLASLLTDDCLENGKGILEGSRYIGGCVMGHGFTNAADGLAAIRKYVYQERRFTLQQLLTALDADFQGHDEIRKLLVAAPKFGNDIDEVDQILATLWKDIQTAAREAGKQQKLAFHTVSSVNPGGYGMGAGCGATPDGRKAGKPFAIGHAPTAGNDTSGLTALFNSVAKADAGNGGAATNFKISRELFTRSRGNLEAMFGAYFDGGGQEATITVVNRNDLESALKEPEKYSHVLVRLGGWCARFIDLERSIQEDIIKRTLY